MKFTPSNYLDTCYLTRDAFVFFSKEKSLNVILMLSLSILVSIFIFTFSLLPQQLSVSVYFFLLAMLVCISFVLNCSKFALTAMVLKRLKNEPANLSLGLREVLKHFGNLFVTTIFLMTFGAFGKLLETIQTGLKKVTGYSLGYTWSSLTFFLFPIMLQNNVNPITAMRQSLKLIGKGFSPTISVKSLLAIFFIICLLTAVEFLPYYPSQTMHVLVCLLPIFMIGILVMNALEVIVTCAIFLNLSQLHKVKDFDVTLLNRVFIRE